ncbi:MAG: diaminopimelate epimerase [Acidobacteria bacterium]|nr:MAG: diaminopimelate epimerase [Acidobacteriota bacterium]PIE90986.1 MAG: diaminopimelate epimerase [Acidobacteriota bacterium]
MLPFNKIHACGNDFILVEELPSKSDIQHLCNRNYGIGADGVMVFYPEEGQFKLDHYDVDGSCSYCLNGARSALSCLFQQGKVPVKGRFLNNGREVSYNIQASPCLYLERQICSRRLLSTSEGVIEGFFLDVGNPHFVILSGDLDRYCAVASQIRHHESFREGANVHLVQLNGSRWDIFSYERGVEDFTLSCGSGTLAAACVLFSERSLKSMVFNPQGEGEILCEATQSQIVLSGSVSWVAQGVWR